MSDALTDEQIAEWNEAAATLVARTLTEHAPGEDWHCVCGTAAYSVRSHRDHQARNIVAALLGSGRVARVVQDDETGYVGDGEVWVDSAALTGTAGDVRTADDEEVLRIAREVTERRPGLMRRLAESERRDRP